jgi:hypothetical protein
MLAALVVQLTLSVGPLVILLGVLLWIVNNPTNAEKLAFWFWSSFRFVSKTAEKNTIKTDITHRINDFVIRLQDELHGYAPPGLELKIVGDPESTQAFIDAGKLVVRLRPRLNQDVNFLTVACLFVGYTTFPMVKLRLGENQRRAVDLTLTHDIVEREQPKLLPTFERDWVNPAIAHNEPLEALIDQLERVDKAGLFLPVLCQEFHYLEEQRLTRASRDALRQDVQDFIVFLHRVALRRVGEEIPMQHVGTFIRIRIQIVSRRLTREASRGKPDPWVRHAVEAVRRSPLDRVYFVGDAVDENRRLISDVAGAFCRQVGWSLLCQRTYTREIVWNEPDTRKVSSYLLVCDPTNPGSYEQMVRPSAD